MVYYAVLLSLIMTQMTIEDTSVSRVTYNCNTDLGSTDYIGLHDLYFTATESCYIHTSFPGEFGISKTKDGIDKMTNGDREGMPIYMNHIVDTMIFKFCHEYYGLKRPIFTEEIPKIAWNYSDSTRIILGLSSQQASCNFEGRDYIVWYTKDIPVSVGPHKFNGLPGLILAAQSTDGRVKFDVVSIELNCCDKKNIVVPQDGKHMSREQYADHKVKLYNRIKILNNEFEHSEIAVRDPPENMYIEKSAVTIYRDKFGTKN